jgi:AraC-like DNA-binding protein
MTLHSKHKFFAAINSPARSARLNVRHRDIESRQKLGEVMTIVATAITLATRPSAQVHLAEAIPSAEDCARWSGGLAPWQARRVQAYIQEHLGKRIFATDLASLVNLSVSHFSRAFRETFRRPPASYIAHTRMQHAQRLMLGSDESLAGIAIACGMSDQSHFTRTFRRVAGVSPGLWRRLHSEGPA